MYNRYIPNGTAYTRISEPEPAPPPPPPRRKAKAEKKEGLLSGLLKSLKLEELDRLYAAAISAERARYDALLEKRMETGSVGEEPGDAY